MVLMREKVVQTALRLLDDVGLENLSLRKLAKELGVQAPTLYWHFGSKQDLLNQMALTVLAEIENGEFAPALGAAWDARFASMGRRIRRGLLAHRDGALLSVTSQQAEDRWRYLGGLFVPLQEAGFTTVEATRGISALTNYVLGAALEEQQAAKRGGAAGLPDSDAEQRFEHGLSLILDGMRARLLPRPG